MSLRLEHRQDSHNVVPPRAHVLLKASTYIQVDNLHTIQYTQSWDGLVGDGEVGGFVGRRWMFTYDVHQLKNRNMKKTLL